MKRTKLRSVSKRGRATKELDALLRKVVLARDGYACRKCGRTDRTLNASHIYPKGAYPHLRWRPENVVTLCAMPCHLAFWHKNPMAAREWIVSELGSEAAVILHMQAGQRGTRVDKKLTRMWLEGELKKLEGAA